MMLHALVIKVRHAHGSDLGPRTRGDEQSAHLSAHQHWAPPWSPPGPQVQILVGVRGPKMCNQVV